MAKGNFPGFVFDAAIPQSVRSAAAIAAVALCLAGFSLYDTLGYIGAAACFIACGFLTGNVKLLWLFWRDVILLLTLGGLTVALGWATYELSTERHCLLQVTCALLIGFCLGQLLRVFVLHVVAGLTGKLCNW